MNEMTATSNFSLRHFEFDQNDLRPTLPHIYLLPRNVRFAMATVVLVTLTAGNIMDVLFYHYYANQEKFRPINVLILLQKIVHHITTLFIGANIACMLILNTPMADLFGSGYCYAMNSMILVHAACFFSSNCGMAICRILYIKQEMFARYVIGEMNMIVVAVTFQVVLVTYTIVAFNMNRGDPSPVLNFCLGRSEVFSKVLYDYRSHDGTEKPVVAVRSTVLIVYLVLVLMEGGCYVTFFHHVYKHNNNLHKKRLLSNGTFKQRCLVNAISMWGQIILFIYQLFLLVLTQVVISPSTMSQMGREVANYLMSITGNLYSFMHLLVAPELRRHFRNLFRN